MTDPYLADLEFANKANIDAARKFKAERDDLLVALRRIRSLGEKNVAKYAREIAGQAIDVWAATFEKIEAISSTERRCQKCGSPTKGEEAYVDGQFWCHPCADNVALPSTDRNQP